MGRGPWTGMEVKWGVSDNNRRARFYELTRKGRRQLVREADPWQRLVAAMGRVLGTEGQPAFLPRPRLLASERVQGTHGRGFSGGYGTGAEATECQDRGRAGQGGGVGGGGRRTADSR